MIKIFQKQWLNIGFDEFCIPNPRQLANIDFYKNFYQLFHERYPSETDLPVSYIQDKHKVAHIIAGEVSSRNIQRVLSFGCGNGVVEKKLNELLPNLHIVAYEPDEINLKWLKGISNIVTCHGKFPECLPQNLDYGLIYLSGIDPVWSNQEYVATLVDFKKITSAPILFTNVIKPYPSIAAFFKYWIKFLLYKANLYNPGQLWGYLRHIHEHEMIFKQAGYVVTKKIDLSRNYLGIEILSV